MAEIILLTHQQDFGRGTPLLEFCSSNLCAAPRCAFMRLPLPSELKRCWNL